MTMFRLSLRRCGIERDEVRAALAMLPAGEKPLSLSELEQFLAAAGPSAHVERVRRNEARCPVGLAPSRAVKCLRSRSSEA